MKEKIEWLQVQDEALLPAAKELILEYANSLSVDLCFQNFSEEMNSLLQKYGPPEGLLLLARVNGEGAGCVAMRGISEDVCEMKRLYVREGFRGLGLGKSLVTRVIEEAKQRGYSFIRLDTLPEMKSAQGLYEDFGFYDINPYVYNPVERVRYMELRLKP